MMRFLALNLVVVTGCGPASVRPDAESGAADIARADARPWQEADASAGCEKIDVLFIIDDSGSMAEEQNNLIENFSQFVNVLDATGFDYRIGVTTTGRQYSFSLATPFGDLPTEQAGHDGRLLAPTQCQMTRNWIESTDVHRTELFACVAAVGTNGPGLEMPLGVMRDAFSSRINDGANAGFVRSDALLAIVMITDENDCSRDLPATVPLGAEPCDAGNLPVADYVTFMDHFTGGRSKWAVSIISGTANSACSSDLGEADAAPRLHELVSQVGDNASASSICVGDLASGLAQSLTTFAAACDAFSVE